MVKYEKRTCPSFAEPGQAVGGGLATSISLDHFTSSPAAGQFKISELLSPGQENALPLRHLVRITGENERIVRRKIAAERLAGIPILSDCKTGYFLPGTVAEARKCVRSMRNRAKEIERAAEAIAAATGEV